MTTLATFSQGAEPHLPPGESPPHLSSWRWDGDQRRSLTRADERLGSWLMAESRAINHDDEVEEEARCDV
jgi:hypothetical protein